MYRYLSLALVWFSWTVCSSKHLPNIIGAWISQECKIEIRDTSSKSINLIEIWYYKNDRCKVSINEDSIIFSKKSSDNGHQYINKVSLQFVNLTDSFLYLIPNNSKSQFRDYRNGTMKFTRQKYLIDQNFELEKIIFHSTGCFGNCPFLDIEIDSNKNIFLNG